MGSTTYSNWSTNWQTTSSTLFIGGVPTTPELMPERWVLANGAWIVIPSPAAWNITTTSPQIGPITSGGTYTITFDSKDANSGNISITNA